MTRSNPFQHRREGGANGRTGRTSGSDPAASSPNNGSRGRGGPRDPEYASVPNIEGEDGFDDYDDDLALDDDEFEDDPPPRQAARRGGGRARRVTTRAAPPGTNHRGSSSLRLCGAILAVVAAAIGLWYLQRRVPIWQGTAGAGTGTPSSTTTVTTPQSDAGRFGGAGSDGGTAGAACPASDVRVDAHTIHYNPSAVNNHPYGGTAAATATAINPLDGPIPPGMPLWNHEEGAGESDGALGYLRSPAVHNGSLVCVCEGDLYYARLDDGDGTNPPPIHALRLTTTVGNVQTPHWHPTRPYWIAYTATYTSHRDAYLLNAVSGRVHRLTYGLDSAIGISKVVGWKNDDFLLVTAYSSTSKHLPSIVVHELAINWTAVEAAPSWGGATVASSSVVASYKPLPLAQAVDGAYHTGPSGDCFYFVRSSQSSQTVRYTGGTVEQLWRYCDHDAEATLLTPLRGTSKSPAVVRYGETDHLFYLSDRDPASASSGDKAKSSASANITTMNLWVLPLARGTAGTKPTDDSAAVPLTRASCHFAGLAVREYAVDARTGAVVLRIGADLYRLSKANIEAALSSSGTIAQPQLLPVRAHSDFQSVQERMILVTDETPMAVDVLDMASGGAALLAVRGQAWVAPVTATSPTSPFTGGGQNLPRRRYRVAPSSGAGGSVRILAALHVPLLLVPADPRRLALLLATDPLSRTAEHAFYLVEVHEGALVGDLAQPALGGHLMGGSTADGGLGSVLRGTVKVSPCGRRVAWADTDGRICVWTLPVYGNGTTSAYPYQVLPSQNEQGEYLLGTTASLEWSPGGRYLAVTHSARNQFEVISIADCGDPTPPNTTAADLKIPDIRLGRVVQVTSNRFNSNSMYWGKSAMDYYVEELAKVLGVDLPAATTLYFLTDRDIATDVDSPWGSRAPSPHFPRRTLVYALPLASTTTGNWNAGRFSGGGAQEIFDRQWGSLLDQLTQMQRHGATTPGRRLQQVAEKVADDVRSRKLNGGQGIAVVRWLQHVLPAGTLVMKKQPNDGTIPTNETINPGFPVDMEIDFGSSADWTLAKEAYRLAMVPKGSYISIVSQTLDDPSLVVVEVDDSFQNLALKVLATADYPSDVVEVTPVAVTGLKLSGFGQSSSRRHMYFQYAPGNKIRVVDNTAAGLMTFMADAQGEFRKSFADTAQFALSVHPRLEYQQLYRDAWRLLRDYFYDANMHGVDWPAIFERYSPLVDRCTKREDLDDILQQMAAELSALHVFVYGGEYDTPFAHQPVLASVHEPASLGVTLERAPEWKGYRITEIPQRDPDFNVVNDMAVFCPLSDATLRLSGQKGLQEGDVIVAVNGESLLHKDIYSLLRGMSDRTVRLEVLRLASGENSTLANSTNPNLQANTEPVVTTAIDSFQALDLRYHAWEWSTRLKAMELAKEAGFSVAYIHLRTMMTTDEDTFARNFYSDYDKDALILDVRHNGGGNIDSWILTALQRKAWMYWKSRTGTRNGNLDWDEQFAFRGHIVVLVNEHTASDGEGVARGISELGLGRVVGTRTWGGGIWLSSDNGLVDGGIATAPEIGTFNAKFGYGMGIENVGIDPDVVVDNNPRTAFDGKDTQLERAIVELKEWLRDEPIVVPTPPEFIKDVSLHEDCPAP